MATPPRGRPRAEAPPAIARGRRGARPAESDDEDDDGFSDALSLDLDGLHKPLQAMVVSYQVDPTSRVTPALVNYARGITDEGQLMKLANLVVLGVMRDAPRKARIIALVSLFPYMRFELYYRRERPAPTPETRRADASAQGGSPMQRLITMLTFSPEALAADLSAVLYGFFEESRPWVPAFAELGVRHLLSVVNNVIFWEIDRPLHKQLLMYQVASGSEAQHLQLGIIPKVLPGLRALGAQGYRVGFSMWPQEAAPLYDALGDVPAVDRSDHGRRRLVDTILLRGSPHGRMPDQVDIEHAMRQATRRVVVWVSVRLEPITVIATYAKGEDGVWRRV